MKPLLFGAFLLIFVAVSYTTANNLKLVLDKLDKTKDAEHILKTDLTFDKVDGEAKINGKIVQAIDLDDEYKIKMEIFHASEKDGDYKKVVGIYNVGVCQFMANQYKNYLYENLKNYANAPDPDKCPVTQETYVIENYPFNSTKYKKILQPGFYKIIKAIIHNEEEVLTYTIEGHTQEE